MYYGPVCCGVGSTSFSASSAPPYHNVSALQLQQRAQQLLNTLQIAIDAGISRSSGQTPACDNRETDELFEAVQSSCAPQRRVHSETVGASTAATRFVELSSSSSSISTSSSSSTSADDGSDNEDEKVEPLKLLGAVIRKLEQKQLECIDKSWTALQEYPITADELRKSSILQQLAQVRKNHPEATTFVESVVKKWKMRITDEKGNRERGPR